MRLTANRRGFTLVELVIVGALIALFSTLAIFGVQQQFRSNIRKATIGETRQLAQSLDFANLDTSVFPKLCWLGQSEEQMRLLGDQVSAGNDLIPFDDVDIYGRRPGGGANRLSFATRMSQNWEGSYFAMSQSRAGAAQGRGGFVYMVLPELGVPTGVFNGPNSTSTPSIRWPADPYNNPYVVYLLDIDRGPTGTDQAQLQFVTDDSPENATTKGNFVNAVVSYGPNHVPGGHEFFRADFQRPAGSEADVLDEPGAGAFQFRLYSGFPGSRINGIVTFQYLERDEFTPERANVWSRDFIIEWQGTLFNVADIAEDENGQPSGIADTTSDDIVFEF